jgi:hypothetical protein
MHIYKLGGAVTQLPKWPKPKIPLLGVLRVNGGHWRYDLTAFLRPIKVDLSRHKSVERIKPFDKHVIAWNTKNLIAIRNSTGRYEVKNIQEIEELARSWREQNPIEQRPTRF